MASNPFRMDETIAAAIVAGVGTALVQIKLDTLDAAFHVPMLHAFAEWWPMLLIIAGLLVWLAQPESRDSGHSRTETQ